jgi:LacI family gluconate utilization system Gnt-I transcriptional repressor
MPTSGNACASLAVCNHLVHQPLHDVHQQRHGRQPTTLDPIVSDNPPPQQKASSRGPRRGTGGVTLGDVSRIAGVAPITVSRALNTPSAVSPATLGRVQDAIARTGYVPNLIAGGLASNRSRLVAAVVPTLAGPVFLETIGALTEALAEANCQLMLGQSGYTGSREDALISAIIGRRPEGIVLTGIMHSAAARRRLAASGIPVVETWDLTDEPIDMVVGFSHRQAGAAIARYLLERGYRRAAVVSADDERAGQRSAGFIETMREAGIEAVPAYFGAAPSTLANGRAGLRAILAQDPQVDVIACSSDVLAQGVITEAQARGLQLPRQLGIMGFGDLEFAAHLNPALSTVRIDGTAIGRQAARFILDRAAGRRRGPDICDIGFSIVSRDSA